MASDPTTVAADALSLKRTPLHGIHVEQGARMVPFSGYEMPVQYPLGVLKEHLWTRDNAGLFDVAHMGLCFLQGPDHATTAKALEALVPAEIQSLAPGQQRYTQLLGPDGGILDDLMVTRSPPPVENGTLVLVVNAGRKDADYAHIKAHLPETVKLFVTEDRALVALQGPTAASVLAELMPGIDALSFMTGTFAAFDGRSVFVTRSGYTGEDGFELAVLNQHVTALWQRLCADPRVRPIGLGARDSLRLEAGLCLYGHDIDETTSPVEAGLQWSIQKRRRNEGGFPGAARIQRELQEGPSRRRVGLKPEGRALAREGAEILSVSGERIGTITSGGFGPTVNAPIAMGYVASSHAMPDMPLQLLVRGKPHAARTAALPFAPHRYVRQS